MGNVLKFLNENSGAFSVLFAALVTLATLVYAFLTWVLVAETRRMRKAQTDAKVSIGFETREDYINILNLVVRNEGVGPARDISFEVSPMEPEECDESLLKTIKELGIVAKGIPYLSPNQQFKTFLTSMVQNFEKKIETRINIQITYTSSSGERHHDNYLLDFSSLRGLRQTGTPPLHGISKNIEKIQMDIGHLASGSHKLKVIAYTKQEILDEEREWEEEVEKMQSKIEATEPNSQPDGIE